VGMMSEEELLQVFEDTCDGMWFGGKFDRDQWQSARSKLYLVFFGRDGLTTRSPPAPRIVRQDGA